MRVGDAAGGADEVRPGVGVGVGVALAVGRVDRTAADAGATLDVGAVAIVAATPAAGCMDATTGTR